MVLGIRPNTKFVYSLKAAAVTDSCFLCAVAHVFVLIKIYQFRILQF